MGRTKSYSEEIFKIKGGGWVFKNLSYLMSKQRKTFYTSTNDYPLPSCSERLVKAPVNPPVVFCFIFSSNK